MDREPSRLRAGRGRLLALAFSLITLAALAVGPVGPLSAAGRVSYVALGDSLAAGVLASGGGYVQLYAEWLGTSRYRQGVDLANLGTCGWTSTDLLAALSAEPSHQAAVRGAGLITLDIGGNDILRCGSDETHLARALERYRANLSAILSRLRALNGTAELYLMDMYDPYPVGDNRRGLAEEWIPRFNQVTYEAAADPAYRVTGCARVYLAFQGHEADYTWLSVGDFHPNDAGHRAIFRCFVAVRPARAPGCRP